MYGDELDYIYDESTYAYYSPVTNERITQKQLDTKWGAKTDTINAPAARLKVMAAYNARRAERNKTTHNIKEKHTNLSKDEIMKKAKEMGVHPDMFSRKDDECWKWMRDSTTWLYRHPRI